MAQIESEIQIHTENELANGKRTDGSDAFQNNKMGKIDDTQTHEFNRLRMLIEKYRQARIHEMKRETGQTQAQRQKQN